MDVSVVIKNRRSIRSYKTDPVPEESLKKILEAGRLAPSAHNEQPWKFVVVKDSEKRKKLAEAANYQDFVGEAPVIIVGVALNPEDVMSSEIPSYPVNLAIALDHMTLVAVEEKLGTCWIGAFSQERVKKILAIPQEYKVVALLPLGFPDEAPSPKLRKNITEILCSETFHE